MKSKKLLKSISFAVVLCFAMQCMAIVSFAEIQQLPYTSFTLSTNYARGNYGGSGKDPGVKYGSVSGVFGKAADDSSLHFYNTDSEKITTANVVTDGGNFVQINNFNTSNATSTDGVQHISFQLAVDNFESEKFVSVKDGAQPRAVIRIKTDGYLYAYKGNAYAGDTFKVKINEKQWYKIDVVIKATDKSTTSSTDTIKMIKIYVDNEIVNTEYQFGYYNDVYEATEVRFGSNLVEDGTLEDGTNKKYKKTGLYVDNFNYTYYADTSTSISFETPTLYTEPTCAAAYPGANAYYVNDIAGMTPTDLLTNINSGLTDYTATFTDIVSGEVDTSTMTKLTDLGGKYIRLNKTGAVDELYIPIVKEQQTVYYAMNNAPVAESGTFVGKIDTDYLEGSNSPDTNGTTVNYTFGTVSDLAGKPGAAYATTSASTPVPEKAQRSSTYLNLNLTKTAADTLKPYTIELSVFAKGEFSKVSYMVRSKTSTNANDDGYLINVNKLGEICIFDSRIPIAQKANINEWNKFAFTIYPATRVFDLYLNGEMIATGEKFTNSTAEWSKMIEFRLTTDYPTSDAKKAVDAVTAIDDITMYSGVADAASPAKLAHTTAENIEGNRVKITSAETPYDEFMTGLSATNSGTIKLYTDNTFASELTSGNVTKNSVIVVTSENGEILNYYYPDYFDTTVVPSISFEGDTLTATVTPTAPKTETGDVVLILAVYEGDVLKAVDVSDSTVKANSGTELTASLSDIDMTGKTAKAFVWRGLSDLTPWNGYAEYPAN